jgi:predicted RNase H-like nuclease
MGFKDMNFVGVDACKKGWFAATLNCGSYLDGKQKSRKVKLEINDGPKVK